MSPSTKAQDGAGVHCESQALDINDDDFGGPAARAKLEGTLLRKLDARMSILIIIYILNYIDRNNVAVARLRGFEEALHLEGQQFNTILSVLYIGYILMQVPSNIFLNFIGRPSIYLPFAMIVWGLISILTGTVTNFSGAVLARFFLGFVEAAFFPGAIFLLSKWYKRNEIGKRTALLSCGGMISNAFGTLFASEILDSMEGKLGRAAWRWLFYVEGSLTVFVALVAIFVLPDFPSTSRFLTPLERRLALKRMEEDVGVRDDDETESKFGRCGGVSATLSDWKVWWLALAVMSLITSLSFNAFFPTLTETLGYGSTVTLLLCAPPWIVATGIAFAISRHSDSTGDRFYHIAGSSAVGVTGFIIAMCTMNTTARYLSLFLMTQSYAALICMLAWTSNSLPRPPSKRAISLAFINAFGQLGNIIGSYIWQKNWGPTYRYSYMICIATNVTAVAMCWVFREHLRRLNEHEAAEERRDGRLQGFRYLL